MPAKKTHASKSSRTKAKRRPDPVDLAFAARAEITECEVEGRCQEVSDRAVEKLVAAGYDAWVATGSYKGEPYAWVIFDNRYIDPTFDQFGEDDETFMRVGRRSDPDYRRDYRVGYGG
jgi:hypothetical protein